MRILADVDTGIDDLCALLQLCGTPGVELVGVTTTGGNTTAEQSAANTAGVLDLCGRPDVPVVVGAGQPLLRPLVTTPETHGPDGVGWARLPDVAHRVQLDGAVDFWRDELRRHPGQTTILITGPCTNLALALLAEPRLFELAQRVVIMGGAFWYQGNTTPTADWNFWCDPDAAKEVFAASHRAAENGLPSGKLPVLCSLQVTERCEYRPDLLDDLIVRAGAKPLAYTAARPRAQRPQADTGSVLLDVLADALRFYFEFHHDYDQGYVAHLHDLFAAQVAAGIATITTTVSPVDVEADSEMLRGTSVRDDRKVWGRVGNCQVVDDNHPEEVFEAFAAAVARLVPPNDAQAGR
ncbi:MAG TPA: nucleoside hydrolase [Candidatus Luteococcus avicola]|nr:nucleoside hydrolase [Candidatus Luteococcus avicola]